MGWFIAGMITLRMAVTVLFVLVVIRIVVAILEGGHHHHRMWSRRSVEESLRRRFADGAIDEREYRERLAVLREDASSS